MAARGRISDDKSKIIVTGFSQSTTEEIYKVKATGISNAEKNSGQLIESNTAVVKREAAATIKLEGSGGSCSGYTHSVAITTTNIKPGSLTISSYPDFISSFTVTDARFCYNLYPNYGGADNDGCVVVAGTDIYGNSILSNCFTIQPGPPVPNDAINLTCEEGYDEMLIAYNETGFTLNYALVGNIVPSTISIYDTEGNVLAASTDKTSPDGYVHVSIPKNMSRNIEQVYKITISGLNDYGVLVISNTVTVRQKPMEGGSQFYLTGENIPYYATTGYLTIHQSGITDIGIVSVSDNITEKYISADKVNVETEVNNTSSEKVLEVRISGRTGTSVVYADGAIYQEPGVFLKIATGETDNIGVSSYTNPVKIEYYSQSHTFRYISVGVTGITASGDSAFSMAGGRTSINSSTKIVTLSFNKNMESSERVFRITLTGNNGNVSATYIVTQKRYGDGEFNLSAKSGFETSDSSGGTIGSATTEFQLNINYPDDGGYSYFGVFRNDSTSNKYRASNPQISDDNKTLICHTDVNTGSTSVYYTLQVSAITADNKVKYTNTFVVEHKTNGANPLLEFKAPREKTVGAGETGVTSVEFNYNSDISYAYVEYCTATTGSDARVTRFDFAEKKLDVVFSPYPAEQREIKIRIGGIDSKGNPYTENAANRTYTITQMSNGAPSIKINGNPTYSYTLPDSNSGHTFSYTVTYNNCTPLAPIYNSAIFSGPDTGGTQNVTVIVENISNDDITYTIKYRGRSNINGDTVYATATIKHPKKEIESSIIISSNSSYLNENKEYVISVNGGTYMLKIETINIDTDSLVVYIDPSGNATAYTQSQTIEFGEASGEGGSPIPKESLVGGLTGNTLSIPAGNLATYYFPKLLQITKDDETHLEGDKYVYNIELIPDTGSSFSDVTRVWAKGTSYDGVSKTSKSKVEPSKDYITFVQSGTTEPQSGDTGSTPSVPGDDEPVTDYSCYIARDMYTSSPDEVPWSGGTIYFTFLYRGIVEGTLGWEPLSPEIQNIEVESLGVVYNDLLRGVLGYRGKLKVTFGETDKSIGDGYYTAHNRWIKITGTSENDSSEQSYVGTMEQEPYIYLDFPYSTANVDTEMFQRNVSGGLLTIPLEANHIDTSAFSYKYCTDTSTISSPTYIEGSEIVDNVLEPIDVGNASYHDKTYAEVMPISLKSNGCTIDGTYYQYYLEVGMQRYKRYDSRNEYGRFPVMMTFKGTSGGSWKVLMRLSQTQGDLADVVRISFDTSYSWWPPTDSANP